MSDWLNGWTISGLAGTALTALIGWLRHRSAGPSPPWHRRLFQVISGSGRAMVAEDALDFTNRYYETTVAQRDRAFAEVQRLDLENARLVTELTAKDAELTRLRSRLPPGS